MDLAVTVCALIFAALRTDQEPKPPPLPSHRVLVVSKDPTQAQARLLENADFPVKSVDAKRLGLEKVVQGDLELLVDQELWDHPSIRLAQSTIRALGGLDSSKPIQIKQLPPSVQKAIVNRLNQEVRLRNGLAFSDRSDFTFRLYSEVTVSDGATTKIASVRRTPAKQPAGEGSSIADGSFVPQETSPPHLKRNFQIHFQAGLADREYWRLTRETNKALEDRRTAMEKTFKDESDALAKRLFPQGSSDATPRLGDRVENLPSVLRSDLDLQLRGMDAPAAKGFKENALVTNFRSSLVLVFHYGRFEATYSPSSLFDLP